MSTSPPDALAGVASAQLLVRRTRLVSPDFAVGRRNAGAVARLCRLLDGIPLALEVAAAALRLFAVEQLADRAAELIPMTPAPARSRPGCPGSLRAGFEWSYRRLAPAEQALFRRLAAPAGARQPLALNAVRWPAVGLASLYAGGHGLVLLLGAAALRFGAVLPDRVDPAMERVVGATLVLLGVWLACSLVRYWRGGADFRPQSRWMLLFSGLHRLWGAAEARLSGRHHVTLQAHGHHHQPDRYGPDTAFGTGLIHGIGAETGTQDLVMAAVGGAASQGPGPAMLLAFVAGLLLSNTPVALLAAAGYTSSARFRTLYVGAGVLAAVFSLWVGAYALLGMADRLPDLQAPIAALFGRAAA